MHSVVRVVSILVGLVLVVIGWGLAGEAVSAAVIALGLAAFVGGFVWSNRLERRTHNRELAEEIGNRFF